MTLTMSPSVSEIQTRGYKTRISLEGPCCILYKCSYLYSWEILELYAFFFFFDSQRTEHSKFKKVIPNFTHNSVQYLQWWKGSYSPELLNITQMYTWMQLFEFLAFLTVWGFSLVWAREDTFSSVTLPSHFEHKQMCFTSDFLVFIWK